MKKLIALTFLVFLLSGCASEAPPTVTPRPLPTAVPSTPGIAKTPPPRAIVLLELAQTTQPDGNIRATAKVATGSLGIGQAELAYPETMLLGETRRVQLMVSSAPQLTALTPVPAPAKTPDLPKVAYQVSGNIQLYPLMFAELRALNFDIEPKGRQRRSVEANKTAEWIWVVSPRTIGRHELAIEVSIPAVVDGVDSELTTDVLQNLPVTIQVQAPIVPTPTPVPLTTRITDSIVNNAGAIIVALIGLVGTVIGLVIKAKSDQAKAEQAKADASKPASKKKD